MTYQFIKHLNKDEHDAFITNHPLGNLNQRSLWGQVKDDWQKEYVGLKKDGELVASAQCFTRKLALGLSMVYITRGPILDYDNQELVEVFFKHLKSHFKKWGTIMIKFDPLIELKRTYFDEYVYEPPLDLELIQTLEALNTKHLGFDRNLYRYAQPRYVTQLDKTSYEAGYNKLANRNIRLAQKKGVEIEIIAPNEIGRFADIIRYTERRKNIGLRNEAYFKKIVETFKDDSLVAIAHLKQKELLEKANEELNEIEAQLDNVKEGSGRYKTLMDQKQGTLNEINRLAENIKKDGDRVDIAGVLMVKSGQATDILYAGFDDHYRIYCASHYLFDYANQWGFEHGSDVIDYGGMEGTLDDGLSQFKSTFNAKVVEYIGEFDMVLNPILYQIYKIGWPILRRIMFKIKIKENQA